MQNARGFGEHGVLKTNTGYYIEVESSLLTSMSNILPVSIQYNNTSLSTCNIQDGSLTFILEVFYIHYHLGPPFRQRSDNSHGHGHNVTMSAVATTDYY